MRVDDSRFALALAGVFGSIAALLGLLGVFVTPVALAVALPFGVATYLLWSVATGRIRVDVVDGTARTRTRGERARAAGGAWRERARRTARTDGSTAGRRRASERRAATDSSVSRAEAYRRLDLEPGADDEAVRRAYRRKVKEVHPDRGGDERAFKRVKRAYERLT
ncbi:MAG: J domain-containing protein [Halobacteriaceae archaeon]